MYEKPYLKILQYNVHKSRLLVMAPLLADPKIAEYEYWQSKNLGETRIYRPPTTLVDQAFT